MKFPCCVGIHKNVSAWELRPETRSNPLGLGVLICKKCRRITHEDFESFPKPLLLFVAVWVIVSVFSMIGLIGQYGWRVR